MVTHFADNFAEAIGDAAQASADIVERMENFIPGEHDDYTPEVLQLACAEIRRLRGLILNAAQRPVVWRVRYCGRWMYFEDKATAEIYAQGDDNAEPLYAAQPPAAPVETIDSVPSCGQENDYRRARDPQLAALRPDLDHSTCSADTDRATLADLVREVDPKLAEILSDNAAYVRVLRGNVIDEIANRLAADYPDNANTNAFCAAIRSMKQDASL